MAPKNLAIARAERVTPVDEPKLVQTADELSLAFNESHDLGTITDQDERLLGAALRLLATHPRKR